MSLIFLHFNYSLNHTSHSEIQYYNKKAFFFTLHLFILHQLESMNVLQTHAREKVKKFTVTIV